MQLRLVFLLGAISLAFIVNGCANPQIVKMSPDTYMLARADRAGIFGNAATMKADVIREANEFAANKGKIAIPLSLKEIPLAPGRLATVEYQFRIVDESDPEVRPDKEKKDLVEFKVIGYSFGKKKNLKDDYNEALVDAKIKAIERAGIKVDSITKVENFEVKSDMVEARSKGTIEPGYEIIEVGYDESGVYKILMIGKVRTRIK